MNAGVAYQLLEDFPANVQFKTFKDGFSKESWVAYGDVYILPRGNGQQVRGNICERAHWCGTKPSEDALLAIARRSDGYR